MVALVLLPGLHGTADLFAEFAAALGPEHEVIAISYPPDQPLDYAELESIARSHLPADRPFVLLGESFSGPIAISIAASAPSGLCGLVLCVSFAKNPLPLFAALRHFAGILPIWPGAYAPLVRLMLGRLSTPARLAAILRAMVPMSQGVLRARIRAVLSVDATPHLSHIRVPVLYLQATKDCVVSRSAARKISRLLPGIQIVELDAPHFLLQVVPAAAAQEVKAFLRQIVC
jgi:pimeloyl-[acyl-carrier protein] methyl ester esterase